MSEQITIPFQQEWHDKMLNGNKTCTSRTKRYGNSDDWFKQFGSVFTILSVEKFPLQYVANFLYLKEGCSSPDEFKKIWTELHPRKSWVPGQVVFVHFFKREEK